MPSDEELRRARIATYLQQRALHGGAIWNVDQDLYQKIRAQVDEEDPTHSLDRNARMYELYQNALKGSGKRGEDAFGKELEKIGLTKEEYLREAKTAARSNKYNPDVLTFADNGRNKLKYDSPEGPRYFGRVGYKDYIMWRHLERAGKVRKGFADQKRRVFHESHGAISRLYDLGRNTPNELSINILW